LSGIHGGFDVAASTRCRPVPFSEYGLPLQGEPTEHKKSFDSFFWCPKYQVKVWPAGPVQLMTKFSRKTRPNETFEQAVQKSFPFFDVLTRTTRKDTRPHVKILDVFFDEKTVETGRRLVGEGLDF
jgi:hypothetical protein